MNLYFIVVILLQKDHYLIVLKEHINMQQIQLKEIELNKR